MHGWRYPQEMREKGCGERTWGKEANDNLSQHMLSSHSLASNEPSKKDVYSTHAHTSITNILKKSSREFLLYPLSPETLCDTLCVSLGQ